MAGQAAYTVRVSPRENGGLIAGAELSWDAAHGNPLRAAIYSTNSSAPVIELAATEISYGALDSSALRIHAAGQRQGRRTSRCPSSSSSGQLLHSGGEQAAT